MKKKFISTIYVILPYLLFAQFDGYIPTGNPITPITYSFLKYGENPVNEYNGMPEIKIPIYTIDAGSIKFPIELKYHAGGIKVAEEASWVGLGWDLDFGNITQIVNDRDDLGDYTKELPDYLGYYTPYEYPMEYKYPLSEPNNPNGGWPKKIPMSQTNPTHSIVWYTDYYVPIDTVRYQKRELFNAYGWTSADLVDSEPDVFKANFNGNYIEFILDFPSNTATSRIVLNNKGYKINQTYPSEEFTGWEITSPDGIKYTFNYVTEIYSKKSQMKYFEAYFTKQPVHPVIRSRTWHLSKITGIDGREIILNWNSTEPVYQFPSFSQTYKYFQTGNYQNQACGWNAYIRDADNCYPGSANGCSASFDMLPPNQTLGDVGFSSIQYEPSRLYYIDTIFFPLGEVIFYTSTRLNDLKENKKLDAIEIKNNINQIVKRFDFAFDYFIGINNGKGINTEPGLQTMGIKTEDEKLLRLKLTELTEFGMPPYHFVYNDTILPSKCSYAVDYWGFYNGKTENISLIPNPVDLGIPPSQIPENGNDHKSDLTYIKAATLETIYYPTGGYTHYDYELNTFRPSCNINEGNGIRIKSVTNYEDGSIINKTNYTYEDGISLSRLNFKTGDSYTRANVGPTTSFLNVSCRILSSSNFYSSSLLGSGNSVGYTKVITEQVDINGNINGKTIREFYNYPDIGYDWFPERNFNLPLIKNFYFPSNGLLRREEIWQKEGYPIRIVENKYSFHISPVYYGVMIGFNRLYAVGYPNEGNCIIGTWEQDYCGYYPIFSGWNSLDSTIVTNYQNPSLSIIVRTANFYDGMNNISVSRTTTSGQENIEEDYYYPYTTPVSSEPYMTNLFDQNRINHPVKIKKLKVLNGTSKSLSSIH